MAIIIMCTIPQTKMKRNSVNSNLKNLRFFHSPDHLLGEHQSIAATSKGGERDAGAVQI